MSHGDEEADRGRKTEREEGAGRGEEEADDRASAARGRSRGGQAGTRLEDRNRQQLYDLAQKANIPGRSKMGKSELISALRKAR